MSKKTNPVLVGSFVLGGLALAAIGLVLFGGGKMFEDKFYCVAYFEESLGGLDIGAPVAYKGVRIGSVSDIRLVASETNDVLYRPVTIQFEPERAYLDSGKRLRGFDMAGYQTLLKKGLRAKLGTGSLLTGKLKVELDFYPDMPASSIVAPSSPYPQLPTVLSPLAAAKEKLEALPFVEIATDLRNVLANLSAISGSPAAKDLVPEVGKTLTDIQQLVSKVDAQIGPIQANLTDIKNTGKHALEEMMQTTDEFGQMLGPLLQELTLASARLGDSLDERSSLRVDLDSLLQSLTQAANAITDLSEYLERHPEALLRGKGGAP